MKKKEKKTENKMESDLKNPSTVITTYLIHVVEGKHYIFYKKVEDGIEVLRFLHHSMCILRHLSDEFYPS